MSGSLFVLVLDFLLRFAERQIHTPDLGIIRACADDVGAALGVLDVQNSLVGVIAPLLGGALLGAVGSDGTPQAAVCLHMVMGLVLAALLPRVRDAETKPKEE